MKLRAKARVVARVLGVLRVRRSRDTFLVESKTGTEWEQWEVFDSLSKALLWLSKYVEQGDKYREAHKTKENEEI